MSDIKQLYERDSNLWYEKTIKAIASRDVNNLDWDNLLEELEDMAKSEKRALRSYTRRLIEHILKLKYWDKEREYNSSHWRKEVRNFRDEIERSLSESPSLKSYLKENYQDWYERSVKAVREEFPVPEDNFVELEVILNEEFFG